MLSLSIIYPYFFPPCVLTLSSITLLVFHHSPVISCGSCIVLGLKGYSAAEVDTASYLLSGHSFVRQQHLGLCCLPAVLTSRGGYKHLIKELAAWRMQSGLRVSVGRGETVSYAMRPGTGLR